VTGARRLSQAISEGDGISVIATVADAGAAEAAETQGAEAIALGGSVPDVRTATSLPVLWLPASDPADADACVVVVEESDGDSLEERYHAAVERGLECVVDVRTEEELELALERIEPEIFLISPRGGDGDDDPLERVLDLLPDVPAGKLAIADVPGADRETVVALERAGFDAVLVAVGDVAHLVAAEPPPV